MKTFSQYIALKEQAPVVQPVQTTQPVKPGQPQPNIDTKKLSDAFTALKSILAPFGIK